MSERMPVKEITIVTRPPAEWRIWMAKIIAWGELIGVIGGTHAWFGGSFLIDLMAFILAICLFVGIVRRDMGIMVKMTREEIRRWVHAGMPEDVVTWRREGTMTVIEPRRR